MQRSFKTLAAALLFSVCSLNVSLAQLPADPLSSQHFAVAIYPNADASKVWMTIQKYSSAEKITLELVNAQGTVLMQETVMSRKAKPQSCRQSFDISQLGDGQYTFRLTAGNQVEERTLKLTTPAVTVTTPSRLVAVR